MASLISHPSLLTVNNNHSTDTIQSRNCTTFLLAASVSHEQIFFVPFQAPSIYCMNRRISVTTLFVS